MKNILKVSTGTIGGAVLMVALNMFLGDKAPWWIEKISIGNKTSISIDVEQIFDSKTDVSEIAKDKDYYTDQKFKFYIKTPSDEWTSSRENPGDFLDGLSVADVPYFRYSINAYKPMFQVDKILKNEITTTTFYNSKQKYNIRFSDSTQIGNYKLSLNPFEDLEMTKASLKAGAKIVGQELDVNSLSTKELDDYQTLLIKSQKDVNEKLMPKDQQFHDNVTITTIQPQLINRIPLYKLINKGNNLNLFSIQNVLTYLNPELFSANIKTFAVNKKNNVLLMETSVNLQDITINNKLYPTCELVRFVLIAVKKDMIYIVTSRFLNGAGSSNSDGKEIESVFNSFRIF